jgi:predicted MPP superfamily phosphohydrolase
MGEINSPKEAARVKKKKSFPARRLVCALLLLAGFGWYENDALQLTTCAAASALLPASFRGFRVAVLSDLHGKEFGGQNSRLLAAVKAQRPNLVALCGDLADRGEDTGRLEPLLKGLSALAPTVYVTGNHEWSMTRKERQALFDLLDSCGVTRLRNDYRVLTKNGESIVVAGVDDPNGPADQKTPEELVAEIRADRGNAYILALCHRNDRLSQWAKLRVQLVLSGHAHGGVVRLPFLGGVFGTRGELFPEYDAGVYKEGGTTMYVSRGLGQTRWLPVRLLNRPELAVITLQGA